MKIRTQLLVSVAVFGIALLLILGLAVYTNLQIAQLNEQQDCLNTVKGQIGELGYISNDYILNHHSDQVSRWERIYTSVDADLSRLTADQPDQQAMIWTITTDFQRMYGVFFDIVRLFQSTPDTQQSPVDLTSYQVSWSRIAVQHQGLLFDIERLSQLQQDEEARLIERSNQLIALFGLALITFLFTVLFLFQRRTLTAIQHLQDGTEIVGSGNFDHRLDESSDDEIGELSHRFNRMTANLKTLTASKAELEREVAVRTRAEEALRESQDQLKEELTGIRILQNVSGELLSEDNIQALYEKIIDSAVCLAHSDYASMQMFYTERGSGGALQLLAFRGFDSDAAKLWEWVGTDSAGSSCGAALRTRQRVIVPDVEHCDFMQGTRDLTMFRQNGIRAMQTTPLVSRSGMLVGMISTHWREPYEPTASELRSIDVLARQAADLIDRKRAEAALRESEERYRSVVQNTTAIIVRMDPQGIIHFANDRALEFFGYSAEELIGRPVVGTIVPEMESSGRDLGEIVDEIMKNPDRFHSNANENMRNNGERVWVEWTNSGIYDTDGTLKEILSVGIDATERKQAEEALKEYAQNLKRSNEDLERFAYVSSHDLQEPLRNIVVYTQLLARRYQGNLDSDADEFIQYIVNGGKRMQTLINDLLDYSRVTSREKVYSPTNVESVVQQVKSSLLQFSGANGAIITYDPLPTVLADESQLVLVFQNLIGNAIKFRREEPLQIHIGAGRIDHAWKFSVRDNGIGIAPEYYDRIFVIFQRLHNQTEYGGGTGIGLAIVKRIIERRGGRVWVESEVGKGSTFYFTIPDLPAETSGGGEISPES